MSDLNFRAKMFNMTSYCGRTVEKKTILDNSLTSEMILRIMAKKKNQKNSGRLEISWKMRNILEEKRDPQKREIALKKEKGEKGKGGKRKVYSPLFCIKMIWQWIDSTVNVQFSVKSNSCSFSFFFPILSPFLGALIHFY